MSLYSVWAGGPTPPALETSRSPDRHHPAHQGLSVNRSAALAGAGVALGIAVVAFEQGGAGSIPAVVSWLVLLGGGLAGLLPLRQAFFTAGILVGFQQVLLDFTGGPGRYWKEVFVALLVARAVKHRGLSELEAATACLVSSLGISYMYLDPVFSVVWGGKILLLFALLGWATARLNPQPRDWWGLYEGVAVMVAASLVIALWQKTIGTQGLLALGLEYGASVRNAAGQLRAFAGFTYAAPFAYTMAVAIALWAALAIAGDLRSARRSAWMPLAALIGIGLTLNRLTLVALAAGLILTAILRQRFMILGGVVAVAAAVLVIVVGAAGVQFLSDGITLRAESADARTMNWARRIDAVSVIGDGPAAAGVAAERVAGDLPSAASTGPKREVVDNQYLTWVIQYGLVIGLLLILAWVGVLTRAITGPKIAAPPQVAAQIVAGFALVAGVAVNIWEEYPLNMLLAISLGIALGQVGPSGAGASDAASHAA